MKIAITGHRPNKLGNDYDLTSDLIKSIKKDLQKIVNQCQPSLMISGMALGIDTLWAEIAIENDIPLFAAIPCKNQESRWPDKSQKRYRYILEKASTTHIISEKYDFVCMQKRNEYMVDMCDILVAVWDGSKGGTGNCVKYAKEKNKQILFLNPKMY